MPDQPIDPQQERETQHLIVLQLLRNDRKARWSRAKLDRALDDIRQDAITLALERLQEQGVLHIEGEHITASACARHMDALNLIGV